MSATAPGARHAATYVLPLRWHDDGDLADLTRYLVWLSRRLEVVVVDGSPDELFAVHAVEWAGLVRHLRPSAHAYLNGKVTGVTTGVVAAESERVVIADDDVRYDDDSLAAVLALLDEADLVGPQNVFDPMPWHAVWDTGRTLLNRAVAADYPGTFAVRRSTFVGMGGYDGNVLFENLELMRTVRAFGGLVLRPLDVYVRRRPPAVRHFLGQRVRQAYDDTAQPWRLAAFLPLVPAALSGARGRRVAGTALLLSVGLAEAGRRRAGGRAWFPAVASAAAPLWMAERAVCSWAAMWRLVALGGVRYAGQRLAVAAHSRRALRARASSSGRLPVVPALRARAADDAAPGGLEQDGPVVDEVRTAG